MHANTEEDESHEELEVNFNNEEIAIAFNPAFLMDPLKRLECDEVTLRFNDSRGAASLEDGENFVYILMPMRM